MPGAFVRRPGCQGVARHFWGGDSSAVLPGLGLAMVASSPLQVPELGAAVALQAMMARVVRSLRCPGLVVGCSGCQVPEVGGLRGIFLTLVLRLQGRIAGPFMGMIVCAADRAFKRVCGGHLYARGFRWSHGVCGVSGSFTFSPRGRGFI